MQSEAMILANTRAGLHRDAAIHAGMQVLGGPGDDELLAQKAAQLGDDGRCAVTKETGVADERDVGGELGGVVLHEGHEGRGAGFLLTLEEQGDFAGQGAVHGFPGAAGLHEGHELALVVGGAATADDLAFGRVLDGGGERVVIPQIERVDGLHVVMAIEHDMGARVAGVAHDHRMAGCGAFGGVKTNGFEIVHQPVGGGVTVSLVGGISGDRGDAQERH